MKVCLFPGQQEALRAHYAHLVKLGKRRFPYMVLGLVAGLCLGLLAAAGFRIWTNDGVFKSIPRDPELRRAYEIANSPDSVLRSEAYYLAALFEQHTDDPVLYMALVRIASTVVTDERSAERRTLARILHRLLQQSPQSALVANPDLERKLRAASVAVPSK